MKKPRTRWFRSTVDEPFSVDCVQEKPKHRPIVFLGEFGITSPRTLARLAEAIAEAAKWLEEKS